MRIALVTVALAGCAQGLAKSPKPDAAPSELVAKTLFAVPGEAMEYQVALRGITIGRVQVAVGQPGWIDGTRAIIVKSRGTSAGFLSLIGDLRWELTTTLDMTTGLPMRELEETWVDIEGKAKHRRRDRAGSGGYNMHAAAGALRGWRSQQGQRAELDVTIEQWQIGVEVWDAAREVLPGPRPAVRYEGNAHQKYDFAVWISDDEARVPLRLRTETRWGAVTVELVDYEAPRG
jgi:hypothetical protein